MISISSVDEAKAYMQEPTLKSNLLEITQALLNLAENDPREVMGCPDDLKLRSSMTLFAIAQPEEPIFQKVIDKFYGGKMDERTVQILKNVKEQD